MEFAYNYHPETIPFIVHYQSKSFPFRGYLFDEECRELSQSLGGKHLKAI